MEKKKTNRNYNFLSVKKNKRHYDRECGEYYQVGMFYQKECSFCKVQFEAQRMDTAFCSPNCQKAFRRRQLRGGS
ncbi:hypothetical protein [Runella zeae]|uniref:hypothetical protein n=1 Tax=Runella zeae TaxID=94255 RepID=UPI002353E546|nr:hypothetical protein [Runella zeae]